MTLNGLALELIPEHSEDTSDTVYVSLVETWIKDALREISIATDWRFLKSTQPLNTIIATPTYDMPNQRLIQIAVIRFVTTNEPIDYLDETRLANFSYDFEVPGKPKFWWWEEYNAVTSRFKLRLAPIPDTVYGLSLLSYLSIANLASGDTIPVPDDVLLCIKHRVRAYMKNDDKDYDAEDRAMQNYGSTLASLITREHENPAEMLRLQPSKVGSRDRRFARLDPNHFSN